MNTFHKARRLSEVGAVVYEEPLRPGDERYEDLSEGRGGLNELVLLREALTRYDFREDRFAKLAFTGHRGCGKTTELFRLEHDLAGRFTPLHIEVDGSLLNDCDYSALFLLLAEELVRKFRETGTPLDENLAEDVARWFAQVTLERDEQVKFGIEVGTEAKVEGKLGFLSVVSASVMAFIRSSVTGSTEKRKKIRQELQKNAEELVRRVNILLDHAHEVLRRRGKPANVLVVFDQLDRLTPEVGGSFFVEGQDFLKQPRAHVIYTVPVAIALPPSVNLSTIFPNSFPLATVKVHDEKGDTFKKGVDALVEAVSRRVDVKAVFSNQNVVRTLARKSGGRVRDLMRLVGDAALIAQVEGKEKVDAASAKKAILRLKLEYERILIPSRVYYPLLAQVHLTKKDPDDSSRDHFRDLLANGSVLAYNGGEVWYDVHPAIEDVVAFQKALAHVQAQARPEAGPQGDEG